MSLHGLALLSRKLHVLFPHMIWAEVIELSEILYVFTWFPDANRKSFFERLTHGAFALGGLARTVLDPLELELPCVFWPSAAD